MMLAIFAYLAIIFVSCHTGRFLRNFVRLIENYSGPVRGHTLGRCACLSVSIHAAFVELLDPSPYIDYGGPWG